MVGLNNCRNQKMTEEDFKSEESAGGIQFMPPLYTQRYVLGLRILIDHSIKSVVDFGCSECGFIKLLPTAGCVERVALVDIDRDLLITRKRQIDPEVHHFLQRRHNPLHVSLFHGSAEDMDARISGFEAATLIEVIEHLHEDVLECVTVNVFGRLRPRLCFVTTPNSEFNVLFKNENPNQFRHWDHKFEWTRAQFQQWCEDICSRFGYDVTFTGVGQLTSDPATASLGPCSQAAVFTINTTEGDSEKRILELVNQTDSLSLQTQPYELIAESDFPYRRDSSHEEDRLDVEVAFCFKEIVRANRQNLAYGEELKVSVAHVAQYRSVKTLTDEEGVRKSLKRQGYLLTPDRDHILVNVEDSGEEGEETEDDESCFMNISRRGSGDHVIDDDLDLECDKDRRIDMNVAKPWGDDSDIDVNIQAELIKFKCEVEENWDT